VAAVRGALELSPGDDLEAGEGPFCAGGWQFFTVRLGSDPDSEPLQVVTRGKPDALTVVEAGADVCSEAVERDAPAGIRTRACGTG
jgi:hypothetical protein